MYANVDVHVCVFISLSISNSFLNFSHAKFILVFFVYVCVFCSCSTSYFCVFVRVYEYLFRGCVVDAFCN